MKKLLFVFIAVTAIVFASCGNKCTSAETSEDTIEIVDTVDTLLVDSL